MIFSALFTVGGLLWVSGAFGPASSGALSAQEAATRAFRDREFVHPLEGPVHISGSFGEYRNFSRYHHGLDYKTFNRNGLTVRAPLPGFVERVHVSERGYGYGLFLVSPDGIQTTYGHLNDFACDRNQAGGHPGLEDLRIAIKLLTYGRGVFVRIPRWFRFDAGDCIARSGESGTGAPHLHFEVFKDGRYVDPLRLRGMTIADTSPPTMMYLYVETGKDVQRLPLRLQETVGIDTALTTGSGPSPDALPGDGPGRADASAQTRPAPRVARYEIDPDHHLRFRPGESVRYLIGGYDTMASRNRNGVHRLELKVDSTNPNRSGYHFVRELGQIRRTDLARSGQIYHTARTVIGREYVYLLYDSQRRHPVSDAITVTLMDSSGNRAILGATLPLAIGDATDDPGSRNPSPRETEAVVLPPSRAPLQTIGRSRATVLKASHATADLQIRFAAGSLHEEGRARLLVSDRLYGDARTAIERSSEDVDHADSGGAMSDASGAGDAESTSVSRGPVFSREGPVFYFDGRDLFYRSGGWATASIAVAPEAQSQVALYNFNYTVGRWLLVAFPYRAANGRMYYRFPFRFEGPLAQLRDLSRPRILNTPLWVPPTLYDETKQEIVREFLVIDGGSGFSKQNSEVLVDGRPAPYEWIADRAVLRISLPLALVPERGIMISMRVGDHSGNRSDWHFDLLELPPVVTQAR